MQILEDTPCLQQVIFWSSSDMELVAYFYVNWSNLNFSIRLEAINRDRKLFLVSLYFLIWGEAANVRFLPECICYIFHNVRYHLTVNYIPTFRYQDTHILFASCLVNIYFYLFLLVLLCCSYLFFPLVNHTTKPRRDLSALP